MPHKAYFSKELFRFLSDLKKHNDRRWFSVNKERYEEVVKEPFLTFIADVGPHLRKLSSHVVADPRPVGGSLFRIYRDVRFSKDKSPYKTHAAAHFRHAAGKDVHAPGIYLHFEPRECFVAGGMWQPETKALRMIRDAIVDHPEKWRAVLKSKLDLMDDRLIRPPQGYDAAYPLIEDIKLKSHIASVPFSEEEVCGSGFMTDFIDACKSLQPLMKFLASATGVAW